MARPVEIDRDSAFTKAFRLFWRKGYRATSLQQLLDAMNIGKSSFYAAFESKEALFLSALSHYREESRTAFARIRSEKKGLDAIRAYLDETFVDLSDRNRKMGCLAVNSSLELADVDKELHKCALEVLTELEIEFQDLIDEAQSLGDLQPNQSTQAQARLLMVMVQGIRVSSRRGMKREEAAAALETIVQALTQVSICVGRSKTK